MVLKRHLDFTLSTCVILLALIMLASTHASALYADELTGQQIMNEVFKRHELFPYVFEEQTIILVDASGNYNVRMARRFSRVEEDKTAKLLISFDNPAEVRGVALLAILDSEGLTESAVYLPAFKKELKSIAGNSRSSLLLGTDFSIEDIATEILSDYRYTRMPDYKIENTGFFVIDALPANKEVEKTSGYSLRRHFIRQDIYFIFRTDYYDHRNRLFKTRTHHDLKRIDGDMWRSNMIRMDNHKKQHKTLIKITDRVFSQDYVPSEMFTADWLLENRHISDKKDRLLKDATKSFSMKDTELLKIYETPSGNNNTNYTD